MDLTEVNTEEILMKINAYKQLLCQTDYKTLKYVDGALGEEEYSEIKEKRSQSKLIITSNLLSDDSKYTDLEQKLDSVKETLKRYYLWDEDINEEELEKLREAQSI